MKMFGKSVPLTAATPRSCRRATGGPTPGRGGAEQVAPPPGGAGPARQRVAVARSGAGGAPGAAGGAPGAAGGCGTWASPRSPPSTPRYGRCPQTPQFQELRPLRFPTVKSAVSRRLSKLYPPPAPVKNTHQSVCGGEAESMLLQLPFCRL